jgi:hypothetical protein
MDLTCKKVPNFTIAVEVFHYKILMKIEALCTPSLETNKAVRT